MRDMTLSVIVRLREAVSGPLGRLQARLERLSQAGRKIGVLGAAIATLSFAAPIQSAAAFDSVLRDIAITSGRTGAQVESFINSQGQAYQGLARKIGYSSEKIAAGAQLLIAAGMDEKVINDLLPSITRTTIAAGAAMEDTSKTAFALSNTLKIPAGQMEQAMGKLVTAGKLGRFEFRDMAKAFPELTAQVDKLGLTGQEAVATLGAGLQIAMYGTDSPETAANNFKNFLSKITAPDAIRNFEKAGIDLPKVLGDAAAKGINPVQAVMEKVRQASKVSKKEIDQIYANAKKSGKTDKQAEAEVKARIEKAMTGTRIGELFRDMQVLDFLTPLLANLDKYKEFKKQIGQAGSQIINDDYEARMAGIAAKWGRLTEIGTQLWRRVGLAFASNLDWMNDGLTTLMGWIDSLDAACPGLVDQILSWAGAGIILIAGLGAIGMAVPIVTAGFSALAAVLGVILSPIGLVLAALAVVALIIYKNWGDFKPFFSDLWAGVKDMFSGGVDFISGLFSGDFSRVWTGAKKIASGFGRAYTATWGIVRGVTGHALKYIDSLLGTDLFGVFNAGMERFQAISERVTAAVSAAFKGDFGPLKDLLADFANALGDLANKAWDALSKGVAAAWEAAKGKFNEFMTWLRGFGERLMSAASDAVGQMRAAVENKAVEIWEAAKGKFNEFVTWVGGFGGSLATAVSTAVASIKEAVVTKFKEIWAAAKQSFLDFCAEIDAWIRGLPGRLGAAIKNAMPSWLGGGETPASSGAGEAEPRRDPLAPIRHFVKAGTLTGPGLYKTGKQEVQIGGRIVVTATGDAKIVNAESTNPAAPLTPDRGTVVGRP